MQKRLKLFFIYLFVIFAIWIVVKGNSFSSPQSKSIPITDQASKKKILDSYKVVVDASKDFQIAILEARVKLKVDEDWPIDLNTMTFNPPEKKEEKKETKP